jgi:hypothetical protein
MDSKFVSFFFGKKSKNKILKIDPKAACDYENCPTEQNRNSFQTFQTIFRISKCFHGRR